MAFGISTNGLAEACSRHPWRVLALWLLVIALGVILASGLDGNLANGDDFTNNPDSQRADHLIDQRMGDDPATETVVVHSATLTVDDAAFRSVVEQTTTDLAAMTEVVASADNYYRAQASGNPDAVHLVSADKHSSIIPVVLATADDSYGESFVATAQGHAGNGIEVYAVGDLSSDYAYNHVADEDLAKAEKVGLPAALIVLIVVFGALIAAGLPVLLGIVTIIVATGLTAVAAHKIAITEEATVMIGMIGLAVGIDYALFVIERYREERRHGVGKHEAVGIAGGTAGKAVLFSGGTVVLALMGMFLIPVVPFHSLAAGAILAVLVAVFATQTLVPALVGLLGDKIDWPRRRGGRRKAEGGEGRKKAEEGGEIVYPQSSVISPPSFSGFWGRITRVVMGRPVAALVVALVILIGLALPVFALQTGQPGIETLPPSDVKSGFLILEKDFYAGSVAPVEIAVDGRSDDPWVTTGVANLVAALKQDPLYGPATIETAPNGDLTVVSVPLGVDPDSQRAYDAIADLRANTIPTAFGSSASHVFVTGDSAGTADFNTALSESSPKVFAFVLGLSFLLLLLAFRSIVVPAKAIVMNLLSVGAAYGVLVLVFQKGVGADFLGMQRTESIAAWVPIFLFCVLFGLSMDYHVFLLSRVREHFDRTGRNEEAVAVGLQATGKIITGAALIMVAVFGAFASGRLVEIQQMGLGLAVAVFLDATVVRSILVPAAMRLLGDRNWYLPRLLRWLPDLRIDGTTRGRATAGLAGAGHRPRSIAVSPFATRRSSLPD
ncbi:MAG TPA: MMPL family transporter [Thermomicrobiales bacterium]|jgi:RND superfamily putative drug exporter